MPGLPAARRRSNNPRSVRTPKVLTPASENITSEPPPKKRRYIPGGPGGGGRYVDADGTEIPVGGTGPGGYNYVGPRGRIGRENAANGVTPVIYERPRRESRRERAPTRPPRYSSAAAAAAAVVQGDGFKPREERSWEEFHQDLNVEARFPIFSAEEVDGIARPTAEIPTSAPFANSTMTNGEDIAMVNGIAHEDNAAHAVNGDFLGTPTRSADAVLVSLNTPLSMRRRPGRPSRRSDAMLKGIVSPETPKFVPTPGPNPREKLTLPKPSFRPVDPFVAYEVKSLGQMNYVDRSMASVGYQESDIYQRDDKRLIRVTEGMIEEELDLVKSTNPDHESNTVIGGLNVGRVEYDMDEQDQKWLEEYNARRKTEQVEPIKPAIFEITMTKIEKEWHALEKRIPKPNPKPPQTHRPRSSSAAAVNGEPPGAGEEQDSKCAICDDGDCENTNAIVFCDGCDLAVHQECYGVPFIPEGQWLCRKCQLIGRGTPTCIFCPNMEGAFKQTNSSKWSHLLCAIWIPEVSLGNPTFMEPVMDVEKVPRPRWKLRCYICQQGMGACIQCSNKNCFTAFHVTCARRARLFLQMKTSSGGAANFDSNHLKAFCHKHVSDEWRRDNDVDRATKEAMLYCHREMRGMRWADSQQSAMNMAPASEVARTEPTQEEVLPRIHLFVGNNKRKRNQPPKTIWKLPSGAPVIPSVVYDSVENSLQRFTVRKRREFAADMCKYWTLKREAKRGAALLKRLQLQMETFSSMEVTRRNFAGMGPAGRLRLNRRIEFADMLLKDVDQLRIMSERTREREVEKLRDAELLRDLIDNIYFPIPPLLLPIIEKAQLLDGKKGTFREGLALIRSKVDDRFYTSVSTFYIDLFSVFAFITGTSLLEDPQEEADNDWKKMLTSEQKEKRKLARRIIKAIKPMLEDATKKESELCKKPFEMELKALDLLSLSSRRDSVAEFGEQDNSVEMETPKAAVITSALADQATNMPDASGAATPTALINGTANSQLRQVLVKMEDQYPLAPADTVTTNQGSPPRTATTPSKPPPPPPPQSHPLHPLTLPSTQNPHPQTPLSTGGIPWYMAAFDPHGTNVYEERYTGREVAGEMSDELSEVDDDELDEMDFGGEGDGDGGNGAGVEGGGGGCGNGVGSGEVGTNGVESGGGGKVATGEGRKEKEKGKERTKSGRVKKRWRGFK